MLLANVAHLAVQVEEPACGGECRAPASKGVTLGLREPMRRREFIALLGGAAAAWPLAAIAQRGEVRRVGVLANEPWPPLEGLRDGMRALGYIENRGLHFEYRFAEGRAERYPALAAELVRLPADAIVAWGTPASLAAKQATGTIPIVMISGDPIAVGLVPGLAHPGANITGLSTLAADLEGKRVELLKELLASLARVAVLSNPMNPFCIVAVEVARAAATALHLDLWVVEAAEEPGLDRAFLMLSRQRPDAVLTIADPFLTSQRRRIAAFMIENRFPSMYTYREDVLAGGLISYATNYYDIFRRAAILTDKILKGAKPASPLAARAQQAEPMRRIGLLVSTIREDVIRQALRDLGYIEGKNILIEYRPADRADQLPGLAAELVSLKVDVIVAGGSQAVRAAQQATQSIPIVMAAGSDPVGTGFVASLARPGGNITGNSLFSPELSGKRLELLKEIVTGALRLAVLWNPEDPPAALSLRETEAAARQLGIELKSIEVRNPGDFDMAFTSAMNFHAGAIAILSAPVMTIYASRIAELAWKNGLPAISNASEFPKAGGLMSYGPSFADLYKRAAVYVDKILKGAKPADLPVEQPTKFELVINLKTAKALGLTVPSSLLVAADEVIE
jgi:putative ABC transport system substrate-binding protein